MLVPKPIFFQCFGCPFVRIRRFLKSGSGSAKKPGSIRIYNHNTDFFTVVVMVSSEISKQYLLVGTSEYDAGGSARLAAHPTPCPATAAGHPTRPRPTRSTTPPHPASARWEETTTYVLDSVPDLVGCESLSARFYCCFFCTPYTPTWSPPAGVLF